MLGQAFIKVGASQGFHHEYRLYLGVYRNPVEVRTVKGTYAVHLDIRDMNRVFEVFHMVKPDCVVHMAATSNPDDCERYPALAWKVNVDGSQNIIRACVASGSHLIFCSSNAVFNGEAPPYREDDPITPICEYGRSKGAVERLVVGSESLIVGTVVRLMTMYGWHPSFTRMNPVTFTLDKLQKSENIRMATDLYNNHLYSESAAEALWKIIQSNRRGQIYHIAGAETLNRYELAQLAAEIFNLDKTLISPTVMSDFPSLAKRGADTSYNTSKAQKELDFKPLTVKQGLEKMKACASEVD